MININDRGNSYKNVHCSKSFEKWLVAVELLSFLLLALFSKKYKKYL